MFSFLRGFCRFADNSPRPLFIYFLAGFSVCFIAGFFVFCRTIYNMCTQKPPHDYSQQLYDRYRESFEEYIAQMVRTRASFNYGALWNQVTRFNTWSGNKDERYHWILSFLNPRSKQPARWEMFQCCQRSLLRSVACN